MSNQKPAKKQKVGKLREIFLKEFVRTLIEKNITLEMLKEIENRNKIKKIPVEKIIAERKKEFGYQKSIIHTYPLSKHPVQAFNLQNRMQKDSNMSQQPIQQMQKSIQGVSERHPANQPYLTAPVQNENITAKFQPLQISGIGLNRIKQYLLDPSVLFIECTGPDKPLIINKKNITQPTNTSLSKEEIDEIMKEISRITRIPLITGVFKAAFNNYIATAVISDYVGTRFVIQKRNAPIVYE